MGWPVILTERSRSDLKEIVSFIALDSSERARRFGNELINQALSIGHFPEIGRVVPELADPAIREIVFGSYRIVRNPNAVYVIRFWHAARGTPRIQKS